MCQNRLIRIICRLAWGGLLGAHAYWLGKALVSAEGSTSSPLLLGIALVFFLLKLLDVRHLRIQWSRRAVLCAILVVVLLHSQVFDQALLDESVVAWVALPVQLATSVALRFLVMAFFALLLFTKHDDRGRAGMQAAQLYVSIAKAAISLRQRLYVLATTPVRGPPRPGAIFA